MGYVDRGMGNIATRELSLRVITGAIGAALLIAVLYAGGWAFGLSILALGLVAQHEVYRLFEQRGVLPYAMAGLLLGALLAARTFLPDAALLAVALVVVLLAWCPFSRTEQPLLCLGATMLGAVYPTALLAFLTDLRLARGPHIGDEEAFALTLAVLVLVWATDILAYFVGSRFGRHLLAPAISPKKTWEGAVGGALAALLVGVILKLTLLSFVVWPHVLVLALLCGTISQLGDLAESRFKRAVGAKDSGAILPGHGGVLDRFDGVLLAAPLAYLYLAYVARIISA